MLYKVVQYLWLQIIFWGSIADIEINIFAHL